MISHSDTQCHLLPQISLFKLFFLFEPMKKLNEKVDYIIIIIISIPDLWLFVSEAEIIRWYPVAVFIVFFSAQWQILSLVLFQLL